ncbi:MAG: type II secretion system major pseudopilin GspG [Candidatus Omnitrophica bacterium]|nr:type II secretion system major pseudopilin GspG [Candidatus Omnitrophota bacterium]MDD5488744.1 type II secretion system major pseudopilin GspG [Candidatus Omnitrophota bacterium]
MLKHRISRSLGSTKGFTLIEILLVVVIISALASMVVPRLTGRSEKAKEAIARADITANIPTALKLYELDNGSFPATEQGLKSLLEKPRTPPMPRNWSGPYVEGKNLMDPWGREYMYRYPGSHGTDYDLYSLGKNGVDDETNITNWD